jgi:hypothetical protein
MLGYKTDPDYTLLKHYTYEDIVANILTLLMYVINAWVSNDPFSHTYNNVIINIVPSDKFKPFENKTGNDNIALKLSIFVITKFKNAFSYRELGIADCGSCLKPITSSSSRNRSLSFGGTKRFRQNIAGTRVNKSLKTSKRQFKKKNLQSKTRERTSRYNRP